MILLRLGMVAVSILCASMDCGFAVEFEVYDYSVWIDLYINSMGIEVSGFDVSEI